MKEKNIDCGVGTADISLLLTKCSIVLPAVQVERPLHLFTDLLLKVNLVSSVLASY